MGKRLGARAACLRIALVALTIQGLTPDPDDLTSSSISRIVHSILSDPTSPFDSAIQSGNETEDELPDEASTPLAGAGLASRRLRSDLAPTLRDEMTAHLDLLRTSLPRGVSAPGELIISLCRLTC